MLVIIEGADGSGKTTLCNALRTHGFTLIRRERFAKNFTFREFKYLQLSTSKFVIDRALLTPWAYRLFDNCKLDEDDFSLKEILELLVDSPIVYCNCANSFNYSMKRGEDNITTLENSNEIRRIYNYIIKTIKLYTTTNIFEYDFEKHKPYCNMSYRVLQQLLDLILYE